MKLFKYEGYKVVISEEAFSLKVFRQIWNRDRTQSKDRAMMELGYVYFMADPRSDYQFLMDKEERSKAVIEGEGLPDSWKPDKLIEEALAFYESFKPASALLLEDTRYMVNKFREKIKSMDFDSMEPKELKDIGALIKQIPSWVRDIDEAEKSLAAEMKQGGKMRGQGEKTIFEDGISIK